MLNEDDAERVKEIVSVFSVAKDYTQLVRTGPGRWKGLCPLHSERTPSFWVDDEHRRFKCWGCGESGDVIDLVMKLDCVSFQEALKRLKTEAGIADVFMTKAQIRAAEMEKKRRVDALKEFRRWRDGLISDLIAYTNAQWSIYRIASRQEMKNATEELGEQIKTSYNEATRREAALSELESMPDRDLMGWHETQSAWKGVANPAWVLSGWRKKMIEGKG